MMEDTNVATKEYGFYGIEHTIKCIPSSPTLTSNRFSVLSYQKFRQHPSLP